MTRVVARAVAPGSVAAAEALWYDLDRWPGFMDGFNSVVRRDEGWPAAGTLIWGSTPHGRGTVLETVTTHEPGRGQAAEVEDERLRGIQTVSFEASRDEASTRITLALDYVLKDRNPFTPLVDFFFIRRAIRDALQRTVARFARERGGDADLI